MNMDNEFSKVFLRNEYRMSRDSVKSEDRDRSIFELLINSDAYKNSDVIFTYCSVDNEVDTLKIIERALRDNKRVALPRCIDKKGFMEFYFIENTKESLINGIYSIKEPDTKTCTKAHCNEGDICLVPGIAFDVTGTRLGHGGGYYDRFLSKFKGKTIGLCYEDCLCEELPCEKYDIKVEMIITEKKIYELM